MLMMEMKVQYECIRWPAYRTGPAHLQNRISPVPCQPEYIMCNPRIAVRAIAVCTRVNISLTGLTG